MNIMQVMKLDVESCGFEENLNTAAEKLCTKDIGCLPVVNRSGQVVGMITDRDICMAAYKQEKLLRDIPVSAVMSRELYSCHLTDTVAKAEALMRGHRVRRIPVVNADGKLVGIVSLDDLASEAQRELVNKTHEVTPQEVTATLASVSQTRER
jgi:CBS domain-containing protein